MNWLIFCLVVVGIIIVLFFPLFFQARFYVNAFCNMATVSITIFGIFVLTSFQVELRKNALNVLSPKKENNEKQILFSDIKNTFSYIFFKQFFSKMKINEISIFGAVGKKQDAFFPCMVSGVFLGFLNSFLAIMQTKKGNFNVYVGTTVDCDENVLKVSGFLSLKISFIGILLCLISAVVLKLKTRRKYEKQNWGKPSKLDCIWCC